MSDPSRSISCYLAEWYRADLSERTMERAFARRLPMPFERARTQLLLGQLQRRLRKRDAAAATLREAVGAFESMDIRLCRADPRRAGPR